MKYFAWLVVALVPGLAWANDKAPVGRHEGRFIHAARLPRRGNVAGAIRGEKGGRAGVRRLRMSGGQALWTAPGQAGQGLTRPKACSSWVSTPISKTAFRKSLALPKTPASSSPS